MSVIRAPGAHPPSPGDRPMSLISASPVLSGLLAAVDTAVRDPAPGRDRRVADALAASAADPSLLAGVACPCSDSYVRHLLHDGGDYAVVALVWRPGQMSPVHAHKAWCALAVHRGILTEHFYAPGAPPRLASARLRFPGDASHGPACSPDGPDQIHRIANCCTETAVSIHAYGTAYARFAQDLNLLLD